MNLYFPFTLAIRKKQFLPRNMKKKVLLYSVIVRLIYLHEPKEILLKIVDQIIN